MKTIDVIKAIVVAPFVIVAGICFIFIEAYEDTINADSEPQ
jgi:hypothetical protein